MRYHYAFEAVRLLKQCIEQLEEVIEYDEQPRSTCHVSTSSLYDMKEALFLVENALFCFFSILLQEEIGDHPPRHSNLQDCCIDLTMCVATLQTILNERDSAANSNQHSSDPHRYYTSRSVTDSLLFRLNVVLQLCMVRIEDARLILRASSQRQGRQTEAGAWNTIVTQGLPILWNSLVGGFGLAASAILWSSRHPSKHFWGNRIEWQLQTNRTWILPVAGMTTSLVLVKWVHRKWGRLWMSTKLTRSTEALENWCQQWDLFMDHKTRYKARSRSVDTDDAGQGTDVEDVAAVDSARNQRLIEYALNETPKTTFWQSQGELRFWMIKRAMDIFYASVGTAIDLTGNDSSSNQGKNSTNWQVPLVTAAVSSFYSVTGARDRVVEVTSSSRSAQNLIKEAWGMVSLPSVKNLSLQASRLLKGAAVADRVEICGISCFCLSRDPAPELAAAIKRNRRIHQRRKPIATLSTIDEQEEMSPSTPNSSCRRPFTRSPCTRYRQRDVIFHLTGGGFFAHIIASDLPYLLDWSAKTGAVVICPEYALLPEHTFPYALKQVEQVYNALVTDEAVSTLGFETNRIVVTGESAGGNLAASLCVKIASSQQPAAENDAVLVTTPDDQSSSSIRMPDALMLSCPVLNLSLELSLSRVAGTNDPVLPSGLLTAISDAYLPPELGVSKREPLASPLFASDKTLSQFPATLLFASSQDPLLDDSVVFNQRLRSLGVESDLFAAINMPHAYLGLGTAGFPEALQVQQLCVSWLNQQFAKGIREEHPDGGESEVPQNRTVKDIS